AANVVVFMEWGTKYPAGRKTPILCIVSKNAAASPPVAARDSVRFLERRSAVESLWRRVMCPEICGREIFRTTSGASKTRRPPPAIPRGGHRKADRRLFPSKFQSAKCADF